MLSHKNYKHSEETKKKISNSMSKIKMGHITTDETKRKISKSLTGRKRPEITGMKHPFFGKKLSKKHRNKISINTKKAMQRPEVIKKRKQYKQTKEHNKNISLALKGRKGRKHTKEYKMNQSKKMIGHIVTKETRKKISLSHGGTGIPYENSEYGAEFDNNLKEQVRFRDKYKCQLCDCTQLENGRQLDVHHKDYDKFNNKLRNLVALCHKCHMQTNNNRDYWYAYFIKEN